MSSPRALVRDWDALEWVKWAAVIAMVADHVDLLLFDRSLPLLHQVGRFAFPAFFVAFGIGLSRSFDLWRVAVRLLLPAALAQLAWQLSVAPRDNLNVLFVFSAIALCGAWAELFGFPRWVGLLSSVAGWPFFEGQFVGPLLALGGYLLVTTGRRGVLVGAGGVALALAPSAGLLAGLVAPLAFRWRLWPIRRVPGLLAWLYAGHLWLLVGLRSWL